MAPEESRSSVEARRCAHAERREPVDELVVVDWARGVDPDERGVERKRVPLKRSVQPESFADRNGRVFLVGA